MSSYPAPPALVPSALISPCPCAACRHGRGADQPVREPRYTSDMSDAEWAVVAPLLPLPCWLDGRGGRPEKYCRRAVIDAIRYVCGNGVKYATCRPTFRPGEPWIASYSTPTASAAFRECCRKSPPGSADGIVVTSPKSRCAVPTHGCPRLRASS